MKGFPKNLLLPLLFYLIFFICDALITTHGIANGGAEGNPVVVWLWSIFGFDSLFLKLIYILLIFASSILIYKKLNRFLGVLIPYSFGFGHLLGFSTWILRANNEFNSNIIYNFHTFLVPYGIFIVPPIVGGILSLLHVKIFKKGH